MQSLVIVIILLSLIGVYINLGKVSELNVPEFNKSLKDNSLEDKNIYDNDKGMSVDNITHHVREQIAPQPKYDAIGNNLVDNIKDGLTPGEKLINLKVQKGFAPNTIPSGAGTRPSSTVIGPYGLSISNLSYKNNFPYEEKYMADVSASANSKSIQNTTARNPKATPYIGEMVLPKDESKFKEGYSYTNRAYAVIRNQITNQNKNLRKILESDDTLFKENIVLSKVLIDKSSPYLKSIIINKGSKAGLLKGMQVKDKDYLVGRIVETNYLSSRVLLLNDLNSRIPVTFGEDATQAILKGNGGSKPVLEYLPEGYIVEEGVEVFTSGKDGIFYPGSPIGTTTKDGEVKLFAESSQLSFVKIDLSKNQKEIF